VLPLGKAQVGAGLRPRGVASPTCEALACPPLLNKQPLQETGLSSFILRLTRAVNAPHSCLQEQSNGPVFRNDP
jgi:hypothetical protein